MKNLAKFFVAVAALFVGVSCTTDTTEDLAPTVIGKSDFSITVSTGGNVRTSLGDKVDGEYPVYWSNGDQLSLNGVASAPLADVATEATSATFTWNGTFDGPFCIAYPASKEGTVTFAAEQEYVEGTFSQNAVPMIGYADAAGVSSVQLEYLAGVLQFNITDVDITGETAKLASVIIETVDGTPIAGVFDCDFATGTVKPQAGSLSSIDYSFGEEGMPVEVGTSFHVAVPAGVYEAVKVLFIEQDGKTYEATLRAPDSKPIDAGQVREFSVTYKADKEYIVIKDATSLATFAEAVKTTPDLEAIVLADVDASSIAATWAPIEGFTGLLRGNGKTISGLTKPLFGALSGTVTNLTLDADISESNEVKVGIVARSMSAGAILRNCNTSGTLNFSYIGTAKAYLGGLVGQIVSGATIFECTNGANITATGEYGGYFYFGGIAGDSSAELLHCTNTGTLELNGTMKNRFHYGGILGNSPKNTGGKLNTCKNNGEVKFNGTVSGNFYMAGVVGLCYNDIIDCDNDKSAKITLKITSGTASTATISGICGFMGGGSTMTDCQNDAEIDCSYETHQLFIGGVAGKIATASLAVTNCANNGNLTLGYAYKYVGGCFGHVSAAVNFSNWTNIRNTGNITWPNTNSNVPYIGGVLGVSDGAGATGVIKDWHNSGNIYAQADATENRNLRTYVGGIAALVNVSRFSYCSNTGDVIAPYLRNTAEISTWVGLLTSKRYVYTGVTGKDDPSVTYADHCLIKGTIKRYKMDKSGVEECEVDTVEELYRFAFADQGNYEGDYDPTKYFTDCYVEGPFKPEPSTEDTTPEDTTTEE